jgi:hypothetical protein
MLGFQILLKFNPLIIEPDTPAPCADAYVAIEEFDLLQRYTCYDNDSNDSDQDRFKKILLDSAWCGRRTMQKFRKVKILIQPDGDRNEAEHACLDGEYEPGFCFWF